MPSDGKMLRLERDGRLVGGVYYDRILSPAGERARVFIALNPTVVPIDETLLKYQGIALAPAGPWSLKVTNKTNADLSIDLNIQRDDTPVGFRSHGRQSYFDHPLAFGRDAETGNYDVLEGGCPITEEGTMSAQGNGKHSVAIGALDGREPPPWEAADYSSGGPTIKRDGPDFSVIAEESRVHIGTIGAGTLSGSTVRMSGTSVAAPLATRQIATIVSQNPSLFDTSVSLSAARAALVDLLRADSTPSMDAELVGQFALPRPELPHPQRRYNAEPEGTSEHMRVAAIGSTA